MHCFAYDGYGPDLRESKYLWEAFMAINKVEKRGRKFREKKSKKKENRDENYEVDRSEERKEMKYDR